MSDWIILVEGMGTGCDYTIDCNKTWEEFDGDDLDLDDMVEEAKRIVRDNGGSEMVGSCTIIGVGSQNYYEAEELEDDKEDEEDASIKIEITNCLGDCPYSQAKNSNAVVCGISSKVLAINGNKVFDGKIPSWCPLEKGKS